MIYLIFREKIAAQEKSYQLALKIIQIIRMKPRRTAGFVIDNQLLRSGTSVGANVEEAIAGFRGWDKIESMM